VIDQRLLEAVWEHDELAELDQAARRLALRALIGQFVGREDISAEVNELADLIDGFGSLTGLMADDAVTDILVNGPHEVWCERNGTLQRADQRLNAEELMRLVDRMLVRANARADVSKPIASGRLPDGSRIHVALPPIAPSGPLVAIRKFRPQLLTIDDLVAEGMVSSHEAEGLTSLVCSRTSILISGATGTGKTTLLNALLGRVGSDERVVTVEETPELRPSCPHWASLVARDPNVEGGGAVSLMTLVRAALRMRPDRVVVGEVRGDEALSALSAFSTGHEGSMVTLHAHSPVDALERMVSLALSGGSGASEGSLRRQVRSAFGAVVHLRRERGGIRRVAAIEDVT